MIVTVRVPVVAVLLAVNVTVLMPVAGFGLNVAVTPVPSPEADNVTLPVNPFAGVAVIVDFPEEDRVMLKLLGEADSVKLPDTAAFTVSVTVAVCVIPPPMAVTTMEYVPVAVVDATVMVIVELPEPGAANDAGLKLTVTPDGCPLADNATLESNPPDVATVMVDIPGLPRTTETELGEAEMLKLGDVDVGASALINAVPFGLPQPLAKS